MRSHTDPSTRAGLRQWAGLAALVLPTLLLSIDVTVLALALPALAADLGAGSTEQLWILDVYGFLIAGFLITMGTLGDRFGRRRLLMYGAAAFAVLSAIAAWSTSPGMLIVLRGLLGIAGATIMPSTLSLIRHLFTDAAQRRLAVALWSAGAMGGMALGPVVGGLLLEWFWWGSVFLIAVPVMALVLAARPLLPEHRDPAPGRVDAVSIALSLTTMLLLVHGLKDLARHGPQFPALFALLCGLAAGWLFVRRQSRLDSPLLDLSLLRNSAFASGLGTVLLASMPMGVCALLLSQYLQLVEGMSPARAGLWLVPNALVGILGMLLTPRVAARWGDRATTVGALTLGATGFALLAQTTSASPLFLPIGAVAVVSLGMSPLIVLVNNLVLATAPKERSGSAASMSETCLEVGAALGVAALGALAAFVYRIRLGGAAPADLRRTRRGGPGQSRRGHRRRGGAAGGGGGAPAGRGPRRLHRRPGHRGLRQRRHHVRPGHPEPAACPAGSRPSGPCGRRDPRRDHTTRQGGHPCLKSPACVRPSSSAAPAPTVSARHRPAG